MRPASPTKFRDVKASVGKYSTPPGPLFQYVRPPFSDDLSPQHLQLPPDVRRESDTSPAFGSGDKTGIEQPQTVMLYKDIQSTAAQKAKMRVPKKCFSYLISASFKEKLRRI